MTFEYEKQIRASNDLEVGDKIEVAGIVCTVKKVQSVFHYVPDASIRVALSFSIPGSTSKPKEIVVFFPSGTAVEILK